MANTVVSLAFLLFAVIFGATIIWLIAEHLYSIVKEIVAPDKSIRVPKATIAITIKDLVQVDKGSRVYVVGKDLNTFFDAAYIPLFKLLILWVSRCQAQVVYFLHRNPVDDQASLAKLEQRLNKPAFSNTTGGLQFRLLVDNPSTKSLLAETSTKHFMLVAPSVGGSANILQKLGRGVYRLWFEANHPEGEVYALDCEYVHNANKDKRLARVKSSVDLMLKNSKLIAESQAALPLKELALAKVGGQHGK